MAEHCAQMTSVVRVASATRYDDALHVEMGRHTRSLEDVGAIASYSDKVHTAN